MSQENEPKINKVEENAIRHKAIEDGKKNSYELPNPSGFLHVMLTSNEKLEKEALEDKIYDESWKLGRKLGDRK